MKKNDKPLQQFFPAHLFRILPARIAGPAMGHITGNTMTHITGLIIGISMVLSSLPVMATEDTSLEVVTVSATPVSITEAGSSVSIITAEDIRIKNAATLHELLREVPGFSVSQSGSSGALTQLRVRGAEGNHVLVLIDGIEVNDVAHGKFDFSSLLTIGIERIEIVRGPQSSLWGSDAVAGVVHIITQSQDASPGTQLGITTEAGSFGTQRGGFSVKHRTPTASINISVESLATEGTNISRTGKEDDGFKNTSVNLAGEYQLADTIAVSFTARHTDTSTDFDTTGSAGLPVDADLETDSTHQHLGMGIQHKINDAITHQLNLARINSDNRTDTTTNPIREVTQGTKDTARYQLNLARATQRFSVRLEHETEAFRQRGAATLYGDPNHTRSVSTSSLAMEYRYDGERINLSLSARRDDNADFEDADSWRVTGNLPLDNDASILFASIGSSIKNPTFTERFGYYTNFVGNPDLEPEKSLGWEAGIKHSWLDGRLSGSLAWFNEVLDKEINGFVYVPAPYAPAQGTYTAKNSDGESNRSGLEVEAAWSPVSNLELTASLTYLDATEEDRTGGDRTEVRRPKHSGAFTATYRWDRAALHLAASHTGTQEDDFFPPVPPYQQRVKLGAFTLLSLSGHYQLSRHITLTGRLENIADENYEQVYGYSSPGINGYLGFRFNW